MIGSAFPRQTIDFTEELSQRWRRDETAATSTKDCRAPGLGPLPDGFGELAIGLLVYDRWLEDEE